MAMSFERIAQFCDKSKLSQDSLVPDIYLYDGIKPHHTPGITEQFLDNAAVYHDRYFSPSHFQGLLTRAFLQLEKPLQDLGKVSILDIGSGSGNTVIPLVSQNPDVEIVAMDLSIDLLRIMVQLTKDKPYVNQIGYICTDANYPAFLKESFDFVIGASILHHLIDPAKALTVALNYLKPEGTAIFYEPFEYGCNIMKIIYSMILDDPRCDTEIPSEASTHFQAMIRDYNARFDPTTIKEHTPHLDDKWLFTNKFYTDICNKNGCKLVKIYSNIDDIQDIFTSQLHYNLKLAGCTNIELPVWAIKIAEEFDNAFPSSLKDRLVTDGTVLIKRTEPVEQPLIKKSAGFNLKNLLRIS